MEFLTLHELSVQLDVPVRVLRYRLRQFVQAGKLLEGQDYRRDQFVDDTHFVWKIHPASFMRAMGITPVTKPAAKTPPAVTNPVAEPQPPDTKVPQAAYQTLPKVDSDSPGLEREMIDLLKGQLGVKDTQIHELAEQNRSLNDLNVKLVGTTVQQAQQIQSLLRLTGGKADSVSSVNSDGSQTSEPVNQVDTEPDESGSRSVNQDAATDPEQGSARAA